MFEPGMPVVYKHRQFVCMRPVPGMPAQWWIRDDEGEELRVLESALTHA